MSVFGVVLILGLGWTTRAVLASLRKPPAVVKQAEPALRVRAIEVQPEDVQVVLREDARVRALNTVDITPEVSGQVIEVHPRLEVGEVIPAGETLFAIDPRTYQARVDEAKAAVAQAQAALERLTRQYETDKARLATLERTRDLAKAEFERWKTLMAENEVGTQSGVDAREQAYNAARDGYDLLAQAVSMHPMRIEEARSGLSSAQANLDNAEVNLERARVTAPFTGRVKSVRVEQGQFVAPGAPILSLADDSLLELSVSFDSAKARQWLRFTSGPAAEGVAWFGQLEPVTCTIRWTEDPDDHRWEGTLHRVEYYDPETLKLTVAVRVEGGNARSKDADALPLVEGMFCSVEIPGRTISNAFRLPAGTVSFDGTVYAAVDGRLRTVPVEVAHATPEAIFINGGLTAGDIIVTTRLVDPLENSLLEIEMEGAGEPSA
jgi:RND family efflux transporter MFP subunit